MPPGAPRAPRTPRTSRSGQAAEVDEFLTYIAPGKRSTTLPAGTSRYTLMLSYGATVLPGTFSATLNGADVTSRFRPAAGGLDRVALDLAPGRNVLLLSVDGMKGARQATDRDRLTIEVQ